MLGTVRTFSRETAEMIKGRIEKLVQGITEGFGGRYNYEFNYGYPAVINTDWATDLVIDTAGELLGSENIELMDDPIMAGEDFAFYQQHFPGVFFFLGSGRKETGSTYTWHHPKYNIDEDCFDTGIALMTSLVFQPIPEK
jgi:amidohydrolase